MSVLIKLLRESYDLQESEPEKTAYWHLQKLRDAIKSEQIKGETLPIDSVVGQSEQLKPMVFELANKLAIAGEGDAAISMHRIHNRL